jgi:tRNA threonylcarbamoyladenosine biosynthesis protein TsaE
MTKIFLADAQATRSLGISLGQSLPAGTVILLLGELGAGKTTLVQGIGAGVGITEPIVSPTFTLINEYLEGRLPLYHLAERLPYLPPSYLNLYLTYSTNGGRYAELIPVGGFDVTSSPPNRA